MAEDPFDQVGEALRTTIGSDELVLRMKLGNQGYEEYKRRINAISDAQMLNHINQAIFIARQGEYLKGKAAFWSSLGLLLIMAAVVGIGWSVWAWCR